MQRPLRLESGTLGGFLRPAAMSSARQSRATLTRTAIFGALFVLGCLPQGNSGQPGTGGSGGATGSGAVTGSGGPSSGGAGTTGSAGTTGTAGITGAAGTTGSGASGGGVTGGAGTSGGGRGGGASGTTGSAGTTGGRGGTTGTAGSTGTGGAGPGDSFVSGVMITVHPQVATILNVAWMQTTAADQVWLEFTFTGGSVMASRAKPGTVGAKTDVVLGVPGATEVTVRIVSKVGATENKTRDYRQTTGAVPASMPKPMRLAYDPAAASPEKWIFGSVEDSRGGCNDRSCIFTGTFWTYIMDREARIVWYYADGTSRISTSYPRIARDGEYIVLDRGRTGGTLGVMKMTLDRKYMEMLSMQVSDAMDVTTSGSILYETSGVLKERARGATTDRTIWSCSASMYASRFRNNCYSNVVNWDPTTDTVFMSFPDPNTVLQINRKATSADGDAAVVAAFGDQGNYTFMPTSWSFEFQHFPNLSATGTLLVSSHLPMFPEGSAGGPMQHAFIEFQVDATNRRLTELWSYSAGTEWPISRGGVIKLANGNYLGQYGSGGAMREITPDKRTVFHVKFDAPNNPSDNTNKMLGHTMLVADLYALNGGGPTP
jgi:hypothetical protein